MTEEKLVPELRFQEFEGEWEKEKLGTIAKIKTGNSNVQDSVKNGKYNFFDRSVDIKKMNKFDYDEEAIIYPGEGSQFFPQYYKGKYALHQRAYSITSDKIDMRYLNYMLMQRNNHFLRMAVGSTVKSLRMDNFEKCPIYLTVKAEQEKIGNFFSKIDKKIELQEQLIENLEEQKKGLMQKIFNQEVRFKDENGKDYPEWEEKKLGEIGNIITGETPKAKNTNHFGEKHLWATPGDMNSGKYIQETIRGLSEEGFKAIRNVKKNSILVTCIGSTIGKLCIASEKMSTNQQINAIECNTENNHEFLYYSLIYNNNLIHRYATTQAVPLINKSTFAKIKIMTASLQEQEKIGKALSLFDKKIELEGEILEEYKAFKKGLMQRMFI